MKIKLDENVATAVAVVLRSHGFVGCIVVVQRNVLRVRRPDRS